MGPKFSELRSGHKTADMGFEVNSDLRSLGKGHGCLPIGLDGKLYFLCSQIEGL